MWKRSFVTSNNAGPLSALLLNSGLSSYSSAVTSEGRRRSVRAANPAQHAASVFDDLLEARGMVITQRPVAGAAPAPSERTLLGVVESPPLSEILARMLSYSDNTTVEMLLKEIGRRTRGSDRASAAASVQMLLRQKLGPLAEGLVIADGSGLSSYNRLTCSALVELLVLAGPGSPLVEGLSVAGERGTLRNCVPVPSPPGRRELNTVKAKTGQLNDVTALAGMTVAANGETLTFAMIANKPLIILLGACNRLRRTVMNAAANYTYGPAPSGAPAHAGDRAALEVLFDSKFRGTLTSWRWAARVSSFEFLVGRLGCSSTARRPDIVPASRLLRGERIAQTWTELSTNITPAGRGPVEEALQGAAAPAGAPVTNIWIGAHLSIAVQGNTIPIGMIVREIESARVLSWTDSREEAPPGATTLTLVAAETDTLTMFLDREHSS